jgi:8-oxo-dGTP diphosphatase
LCFSSDPAQPPGARDPFVILLYTCRNWHGIPRCLDAEAIAWFAPADLASLAMPPLDIPLAEALLRAI